LDHLQRRHRVGKLEGDPNAIDGYYDNAQARAHVPSDPVK